MIIKSLSSFKAWANAVKALATAEDAVLAAKNAKQDLTGSLDALHPKKVDMVAAQKSLHDEFQAAIGKPMPKEEFGDMLAREADTLVGQQLPHPTKYEIARFEARGRKGTNRDYNKPYKTPKEKEAEAAQIKDLHATSGGGEGENKIVVARQRQAGFEAKAQAAEAKAKQLTAGSPERALAEQEADDMRRLATSEKGYADELHAAEFTAAQKMGGRHGGRKPMSERVGVDVEGDQPLTQGVPLEAAGDLEDTVRAKPDSLLSLQDRKAKLQSLGVGAENPALVDLDSILQELMPGARSAERFRGPVGKTGRQIDLVARPGRARAVGGGGAYEASSAPVPTLPRSMTGVQIDPRPGPIEELPTMRGERVLPIGNDPHGAISVPERDPLARELVSERMRPEGLIAPYERLTGEFEQGAAGFPIRTRHSPMAGQGRAPIEATVDTPKMSLDMLLAALLGGGAAAGALGQSE